MNGVGKSSLFNMLTGDIQATSGNASLDTKRFDFLSRVETLTLSRPLKFLIKFDKLSQNGSLYILIGHRLYFSKNIILLMNIEFVLGNSGDPDKMLHLAAFFVGFHSLQIQEDTF